MASNPTLSKEFAPAGKLRAALNMGNPVLARYCATSGLPAGVSVDLSKELGNTLGVDVDFVCFATAAESVDAVLAQEADIGFMAIDPKRADGLHFTPAYLLIEGSYAVPRNSPIHANDEVDRPGHQVVVGSASAYDLFLTRHLQHARIDRVPLSEQVIETMLQDGCTAAAGVRQQLEMLIAHTDDARLLDGGFMVINQASAISATRSLEARQYLDAFIEGMKASGFVAASLARHGVTGVKIAPPA